MWIQCCLQCFWKWFHNCNILNFGPNTYRHVLIDYDDYLDVLFLYWVKDPTAYEHDDLFYILGISPKAFNVDVEHKL